MNTNVNIDDIQSKDDIMDVLAMCSVSSEMMAKVFFPERFHRKFDAIHHEIFDLIDNSDNPLCAVAAPRGLGKTSINNLLLPAKSALFLSNNYIVPVSASATLAEQQSENLKYELLNNDMVKKLFGNIKTNNFNKDQWIVKVGGEHGGDVCIMPRGAGQQIRGLLYRHNRPNLIIVDDLEDPENIDSEEQRRKKKKWFYADLMNCIDRGDKGGWRIIMLGTVLHQDSLLVNILESKNWDSVTLEICDDNFHSNAPNFMSDAECKKLYDDYVDDGEVDVFFREYRNKAISTADSVFQKQFFLHYEEGQSDQNYNNTLENLLLIDPARTANMKSADTALVTVGVDIESNRFLVRDVISDKFNPDQFLTEVEEAIRRSNVRVIGIEVTGLHEYILYPIKHMLVQKKLAYVQIIELHARGGQDEKGKVKRIKQLAPFYRRGLIYHNKTCTAKLESQLMSFPKSKLWDIMDALGYLPEILERGLIYMPPEEEKQETERSIEEEMRLIGYQDEDYDEELIGDYDQVFGDD